MESIQTQIECPRCESPHAMSDENPDTGELFKGCPECGYNYVYHIVRDEEGKIQWLNKKERIPQMCEHGSPTPYAAFHIEDLEGTIRSGHLENEKDFNSYASDLAGNYHLENIKIISWSRYNDQTKVLEKGTFYINSAVDHSGDGDDLSPEMRNLIKMMGKGGDA